MRRSNGFPLGVVCAGVLFLGGTALAADATNGKRLYDGKGRCATCHRLDAKKMVGPGMAGLLDRRTEGWLTAWLKDPQAVWSANDAETRALKKEVGRATAPKTKMRVPNFSDADVADIVAYLKTL